MRVPLSWLADYVDIDVDADELARRLTMLGMEVSGVERWGADWKDVVVGELLAVGRHPRADRLSLARVTVGDGEPLEIVCGATNIAVGQRVPVALPGAILPGGRRIERTEKMGVESAGMLCSGDELRLTTDADGILILPPDTAIGDRLTDIYGDWVLDIDVKPNRGDALSLIGLAREVAATTGAMVRMPSFAVDEEGDPIGSTVSVEVLDPDLCPRFVARHVAGVTVRPSSDRVQMRLLAAGVRPISNVVDASNYVMVELGKPIHTFDAAGVKDGRIIVRRAQPGETLETLDHVRRELDPDTLLIADSRGPLGIAGIMGGADSEVSDATVDVIVESALFDPVAIRRTGHRYALRSEASLRFEKGQEWRLAALGADRTASLVRDWAGGRIARGRADSDPTEPPTTRVAYRPDRVDRLLGTAIGAAGQAAQLAKVGIASEAAAAGTRVVVAADPQPQAVEPEASVPVAVAVIPSWRRDLEIEADIAEEVARIAGYESIPPVRPHTPMPGYRERPTVLRDRVRETLIGAGLAEVVSNALTSPTRDAAFPAASGLAEIDGEERRGDDPISLTNPLSRDRSVLRRSLVGSLLEVVATNRRSDQTDIAIFEIGKGYARGGDSVHEWWRLGIALSGAMVESHWSQPSRDADLADLKGLVELVAAEMGFDGPTYAAVTDDDLYHPGRTATATALGGDGAPAIAGRVGEIHPSVLEARDVRADHVLVAELAIRGLSAGAPAVSRARPIGAAVIERDLAIVLPASVGAGEALAVLREAGEDALRRVTLFDIYEGPPLADDERSLAFRLDLQAPPGGGDIEPEVVLDRIAAALVARLGGRRRT